MPNEIANAAASKSQRSLRWLLVNYVWIAGIATFVDTGVLVLLRVRIGLYVWLSAALGYLCGMATNFLLNKYVNFASKDRSILHQARTFFIVASIGLALTSLLMELLVQKLHLPLLVAKAISIAIVMFWSFWGHKTLTFQGGIRQFVAKKLNRPDRSP
ncbi:MAG TPA: GtrA family protein [bacterium]